MIKRDVRLIGVDGKGRVAEDNACAHRHGGGAWAIDLKIPLLRQWQHETCDPLALRSRLIGANRGFSNTYGQVRTALAPRADPDVLHKGFGSFRLAVRRPPRGGRYRT